MTPGTDWIDQAQRLVEALRGGPVGASPAADGAAGDGHAEECWWCPICQVAAVVRGERPEVTEALADVLTAAATALRTVAAAGRPDVPVRETDAGAQESPPPPPVQQIDIA
ncbi:hypothetical protein [Blastococcus mobilis]|uniref:Uncharacterized protein n=1 Tax=Blastococcus mobilis TaxID=1938746 RepID=A0A238VJ96_9ACTN|nr:hypothetical protein [Blastococcus mobilis]SNR34244.1 hypothetical protein SAMN06272737_103244 [Blastococcus mobilis]